MYVYSLQFMQQDSRLENNFTCFLLSQGTEKNACNNTPAHHHPAVLPLTRTKPTHLQISKSLVR